MALTALELATLNDWSLSEPALKKGQPGEVNGLGTIINNALASGTELTADELAAVQGAASPAAGNVFATANDLVANNVTLGNDTLAASTTTVVSDASVATGDEIFVQAKDSACAAIFATAGGVWVDTIVNGVSFTVNHASAAGTETFSYSFGQ